MLISVQREKQKLDNLFTKIESVEEMELKSHWARYLCVLTSGYIENSVRYIISDYSNNKASQPLANFVQRKIRMVTNLKKNNIVDLLNSFNPEWGTKFLEKITDKQIDAIDSVVANRHQIAHGKNIGITYVTMKNYYVDIKPSIKLIYDIVNEE